jgi:hypothetical protein
MKENLKALINIKKQAWTGWNKEQKEPEEINLEVEKGMRIDYVEDLETSALVEDILEDRIILSSNGLILQKNGSGIDLLQDSNNLKTIINLGEIVILSTDTMDAGNTFTFHLLEINQ